MKKSLRLILDSNEFIFGLDETAGGVWSIRLLNLIPSLSSQVEDFALFVPDIIRAEVSRNLPPHLVGEFYSFLSSDPKIMHGSLFDVPPNLHDKYLNRLGLKKADALIAAFAEWYNVDFVVSENRHIYQKLKVDEFITCNAEEFLELWESGRLWDKVGQLRATRSGSIGEG